VPPRTSKAITIYNRTDYQNYPNGLINNFQLLIWNGSAWVPIADDSMFTVAVDTSPYNYPPGPSGTVQIFTPGAGTNAEWVTIEKTDDNLLVLADVGIWPYSVEVEFSIVDRRPNGAWRHFLRTKVTTR
jgi:hypothetical protein